MNPAPGRAISEYAEDGLPRVSLYDAVQCLSSAMDLVSPAVGEHQKRVSYIAWRLGVELGLPEREQADLALAGAVHDCGLFSLSDRLQARDFECHLADLHRHGEVGYLMLRDFPPLADAAAIVRHHHVRWEDGQGREFRSRKVSRLSHLIHLADRVEVQITRKRNVLQQVKSICGNVRQQSGKMFDPELVEAFLGVAARESFWLDVVTSAPGPVFSREARSAETPLQLPHLERLAELFARLMDFRSPFTATHTAGVASTAEALGRLEDFDPGQLSLLRVAGYLHDLGKFAVPVEILEKPKGLTAREYSIIRTHTYFTFRLLERIPDLHRVNLWGALHHERLDGRGYPFHFQAGELPRGSRLMAVADVFTALTENRPYRAGMDRKETLGILTRMGKTDHLDREALSLLEKNYEYLEEIRRTAQARELNQYLRLHRSEENPG